MAGKGSDRRPMDTKHCDPEEFRKRWDRIFSKDSESKDVQEVPDDQTKNKTDR